MRVNPNPGAPAAVNNTATASSNTPEADSTNNTGSANVTVRGADLSITKSAGAATVDQGGSITYTLSAHNAGPGTANNAEITDTVPAGTTFASASPGCEPDLVGTIVCSVGDLASGADVTRTVTVTVADEATAR